MAIETSTAIPDPKFPLASVFLKGQHVAHHIGIRVVEQGFQMENLQPWLDKLAAVIAEAPVEVCIGELAFGEGLVQLHFPDAP